MDLKFLHDWIPAVQKTVLPEVSPRPKALRRYKELLQRSLLQFGMTWHALAVNLKTRFPGTHHQNKFALHILQEQLLQSKLVLLKQLGNCIWLHPLRCSSIGGHLASCNLTEASGEGSCRSWIGQFTCRLSCDPLGVAKRHGRRRIFCAFFVVISRVQVSMCRCVYG